MILTLPGITSQAFQPLLLQSKINNLYLFNASRFEINMFKDLCYVFMRHHTSVKNARLFMQDGFAITVSCHNIGKDVKLRCNIKILFKLFL